MYSFTIDPRDGLLDGLGGSGTCQSCCCQPATARAGETNLWSINYAPWSAPIGGQGLTQTGFDIALKNACPPPTGNNLPPSNSNYAFQVVSNNTLSDSVATNAVDPEATPLNFALMPLYNAAYGLLLLNPDGSFSYTPQAGFVGYDEFHFTTSDGINAPVVNKAVISINPIAPTPPLPDKPNLPLVMVPGDRVELNRRGHFIRFPLIVSPAALEGSVYTMNVKQQAMDCDGNCYVHLSCYDIAIGRC